ncbi:subtype B tannase [Niveibacterium sp. COAC-50]|uniref:subtype B tannase n=1 Tax=Niveibacterium sp. COAC-50 TaxID=2729384 RepID=UPI0015551D72|nr:subtype B tannase [Niveibacterium sp. COAC-50]
MSLRSLLTTAATAGAISLNAAHAAPAASDLVFDADHYVKREVELRGQRIVVRAYENIVYVAKPVDASLQAMNIYVPDAYFRGERIGDFTADTAPIFLPNQVGGYMPALPGSLDGAKMPGPPNRPNTIAEALLRGYVVATPGARGRTSQGADGRYTGKAPAAIVDLKAAVRYLRFNDARMPGSAERIISNGTSAGGALSALLGASGNSADYDAALRALGAAPARDDIFAVSAYCPITNLEHADAAYEWQFQGVNDYKAISIAMLDFKVERKEVAGTLTPDQVTFSSALKTRFPAYLNSLALHSPDGRALTLDADGNGTFKDYVKRLLIASAQQAQAAGQPVGSAPGVKLEDAKVRDIDFAAYVRGMARQKTPPAFDAVDLGSGENDLFGTEQVKARHFTDFSFAHSRVAASMRADAQTVRMMNPMSYIGAPGATPAKHWRIRHGASDRDTSFAIPAMLALALQNKGLDVDFALPWGIPHSGDYDLDALFAWVAQIIRTAATVAP